MKIMKKMLICILSLILSLPGAIICGAADNSFSLTKHDESIRIDYYNTVKIISGFCVDDTVSDAVSKFENGNNIVFLDGNGVIIADMSMRLYTGAVICAVDGNSVKDIGIITVFGDADGDGNCRTADARFILRASLSLEKLSAVQQKAADCDNNGKVTSSDARTVLRAALRLSSIENPYISSGSVNTAPVAVYAYYVGSDPVAGSVADMNSIRVLAVYSDAKSSVIESGFTVSPSPITSSVPGKKTFTVSWNGLQTELIINFVQSTPTATYENTDIPDYGAFASVSPSAINYNIGYITYIYPANRNIADFAEFESYLNHLISCGFICTGRSVNSGQVIAVFNSADSSDKIAMVYDFTGKRLYIAVS